MSRRGAATPSPWLIALLKHKPLKLAAIALANKTERIAWKLMISAERYDACHVAAGPLRYALTASLRVS